MKSHLQEPVLGIVAFFAAWTDEIAAPCRAPMIVIFRDRESCSATAWDEKHAQRRLIFYVLRGLGTALHDSSTVANELFLRRLDCNVFLRSRSDTSLEVLALRQQVAVLKVST